MCGGPGAAIGWASALTASGGDHGWVRGAWPRTSGVLVMLTGESGGVEGSPQGVSRGAGYVWNTQRTAKVSR